MFPWFSPAAAIPPDKYRDLVPRGADLGRKCPTCGEWVGEVQWHRYADEFHRALKPQTCIFDLVEAASRG